MSAFEVGGGSTGATGPTGPTGFTGLTAQAWPGMLTLGARIKAPLTLTRGN